METKYIVNNLSGQTINGDLTINGNVVITGTTNTRPYKVYTALLTQSGGDNQITVYQGESFEIGVTYQITAIGNDVNLIPFGAPNNDIGTSFVCTTNGIVPSSDFAIVQLIKNTGAPTVIVLENTIGNIWFTYNSVGDYKINSDELFTQGKSWSVIGPSDLINNGLYQQIFFNDIFTYNINTFSEGTSADSVLSNAPIEIRVYN